MGPTLPVALACLIHLSLASVRRRHRRGGTGGGLDLTAAVLAAAAAATVLVEVVSVGPQVAAVGAGAAAALAAHWQAFRRCRFGVSFRIDAVLVWAETFAWIWGFLGLARELYATAPFSGVMAGILGFFLPINAAAEVFRAGRDAAGSDC